MSGILFFIFASCHPLRTLKRFGFDQEELEVVYKCYVRPVLEYGDVVWHSGLCTKQTADLERIQGRACRTILGHQFKSYWDAVGKCNLEYLKDRRETHCKKKKKKKKIAQGLGNNVRTCHLLSPSRFQFHGRNLRNSSNLSQYRMKTSRFRNSPVPYFVSLLNKT